MKQNLRSKLLALSCIAGCWSSAWAQDANVWVAPQVPGVDVSTLDQQEKSQDDCVYTYNIGADAFLTYGMNWNTNAIATRLTDGDLTADLPHATWVLKDGEAIKIVNNGNTNSSLGGDLTTANNLWIDQGHSITYNAVEGTENEYYLFKDGIQIDVSWKYGGHLTGVGGKGFTKWAFIPKESITDGSYALYKAKKELFAVYTAIPEADRSTYADAISTAYAAYTAQDATAQSVKEATKTLLRTVAAVIETEVPVNALFTNPDMLGEAGNISDWSTVSGNASWSEFEVYHAGFVLTQTATVPNGLYKVVFHALYRSDGDTSAPSVSVNGDYSASVPEMRTLDYGVSNTGNGNGWANNNGWIPNNMQSCGQALTHDGAVAVIDNIKVRDGEMTITVTESGVLNWNNFQGFEIYYQGAINMALYKQMKSMLDVAESLEQDYICASVLADLQAVITKAGALTANSEEEELDAAISELNQVVPVAQSSIASNKLIEAGKVSTDDIEGWTCTNSNDFHVNTWSIEGNSDGSGMTTNFIENWVGSGNKLGDGEIRYTLSNIKHGGLYKVSLLVRVLNESGDKDISGVSLVANDKKMDATKGRTCNNGIYETYSIVCNVEENGNLTFGFDLNDVTFNWIAFKNITIERLAEGLTVTDGEALIPEDIDLDGAKCSKAAKDAFNQAKTEYPTALTADAYNALGDAIHAVESSITAYAPLKTAIEECNAKAETLEQSGRDAYNTTATAVENAYKEGTVADADVDNEIVKLNEALRTMVKAQQGKGVDMTQAIINPSFETGDTTGWTFVPSNDMGARENSNSTYNTSGCDGNYLLNIWDNNNGVPVSQVISGMPDGVYELTVACANTGAVYTLMNQEVGKPDETDTGRVFGDLSCKFVVSGGKIEIKLETDGIWYKVDNFRLTYWGELDYTALQNAIVESTQDKVMGFEAGQYAPYNNVEAMNSLKTAGEVLAKKDLVEQDSIDKLVESLAGVWVVNEKEVNAVYDGDFAIQPEQTTAPATVLGWTGEADNFRQLIKDVNTYPGLADADAKAALYVWGADFMYGSTEGYTMPLAAHTIYELTFKQAGWNGANNWFEVAVQNEAGEGLAMKNVGQATEPIQNANSLVPVKVRFQTGEAGNYVLTMRPSGNTVFTDVALYTAKAEDIDIALKAEYGTMILPFAAEIPQGLNVYSVEDATPNGQYQTLNLVNAASIEANVPYIVQRESEENSVFKFTGIACSEESAYTEGMLTGVLADTFAPLNSYVLQNQNGVLGFYRVDEEDAVKVTPYHAYLNWSAPAEVRGFVFDLAGDVTSVAGVAADDASVDVYSINGVLIRKDVKASEALQGLAKGLYIVNGVKRAVK